RPWWARYTLSRGVRSRPRPRPGRPAMPRTCESLRRGPGLANLAGVRSLLLLLVLAVAGGVAVIRHLPEEAQAEPARVSRPQEIASVALDGRDLPTAALREVLATRAGELIDLEALARDRRALEAALVARGHLAAKVGEPRVTFGTGGAAYVTFPVSQGP